MPDNIDITNPAAAASVSRVRTDELAGGIQIQIVKLDVGGDGLSVPVVGTMPVSGTVTVANPTAAGLTDAQLRVVAVPVSIAGTVEIANDVGNPLPTRPSITQAGSAVILAATATANPGTAFTALPSAACVAVDLINQSGTAIEVRRGGAGNALPIPNGAARLMIGVGNANELSVRRVDLSNTPVNVHAEALSA